MVLVLRPDDKAQRTAEFLKHNGVDAYPLACIKIAWNDLVFEALLSSITQNKFDIYIVTSTYVAERLSLASQTHANVKTQLRNANIYCVGHSSADILAPLSKAKVSELGQDSESLLKLNTLQYVNVKNKKVALLKGYGGRSLIKSTLENRGAYVEEVLLYKRELVTKLAKEIDAIKHNISAIITTSNEICEQALRQFELSWLKTLDWIVVSKRAQCYLYENGITSVNVSNGAQDPAILACIQELDQEK